LVTITAPSAEIFEPEPVANRPAASVAFGSSVIEPPVKLTEPPASA
jgi:hypothetical protein